MANIDRAPLAETGWTPLFNGVFRIAGCRVTEALLSEPGQASVDGDLMSEVLPRPKRGHESLRIMRPIA